MSNINNLSAESKHILRVLLDILRSAACRGLFSKITHSMQFAASIVLLLQLCFPKQIEELSCDNPDSDFFHDMGLMGFAVAFIFRFWIVESTGQLLYIQNGESQSPYLPHLSTVYEVESWSTDTVNTIASIYFLDIPPWSKNILYSMSSIWPGILTIRLLIGLLKKAIKGKQFQEEMPLIQATTQSAAFYEKNKNIIRNFFKINESVFAGLNLSSSVIMIVQFFINLAYDSVHNDEYPYTDLLTWIFGSLAMLGGSIITFTGKESLQDVLARLQTASDSFYYPFTTILSATGCIYPHIMFDTAGVKQTGYKVMIGTGIISTILSVIDYFNYRAPSDDNELRRVVLWECSKRPEYNTSESKMKNIVNFIATYLRIFLGGLGISHVYERKEIFSQKVPFSKNYGSVN